MPSVWPCPRIIVFIQNKKRGVFKNKYSFLVITDKFKISSNTLKENRFEKYIFLGRDITDDDNHVAPASGVRAFTMFLSGLENYQKMIDRVPDLPNLVENHGAKGADHDDHRDDNHHQTNH